MRSAQGAPKERLLRSLLPPSLLGRNFSIITYQVTQYTCEVNKTVPVFCARGGELSTANPAPQILQNASAPGGSSEGRVRAGFGSFGLPFSLNTGPQNGPEPGAGRGAALAGCVCGGKRDKASLVMKALTKVTAMCCRLEQKILMKIQFPSYLYRS